VWYDADWLRQSKSYRVLVLYIILHYYWIMAIVETIVDIYLMSGLDGSNKKLISNK